MLAAAQAKAKFFKIEQNQPKPSQIFPRKTL
jgi:hypothetical protein